MLTVTHSSIECFRTCRTKYHYTYDQKLKPRRKSWPLLDGEAVHLGLEWLYLNRVDLDGSLMWPTVESITPIISRLYEDERGGEEYESEVTIHKGTVIGMLQGYVLAYPANEYVYFKPEVKGRVAITDRVELAFKTDAMVLTNRESPYLFETKTTSASDMAKFLDNLGLDDQPDTYLYGSRRMGKHFLGVIYNVIRKPKFKQSKFESDENFVRRIQKALIEDAKEPAKERKYYFRDTIYRSEVELMKFEQELLAITADMEHYKMYRSPKRCGDSFGQKCEFLPMCSGSDCEDMFAHKTSTHEELEDR